MNSVICVLNPIFYSRKRASSVRRRPGFRRETFVSKSKGLFGLRGGSGLSVVVGELLFPQPKTSAEGLKMI